MSDLPQVSIVTPVYNGQEYLQECIESILAQTYRNWDYTIIDNCSTDRTSEVARSYASKDSRIRICTNRQFLSVISNHNRALRHVSPQSRYAKVVFADDRIYPECLEHMVAVAERHPNVGLVSALCLEGERIICTGLPAETEVADGREICRRHLLDRLYLFGSANTVLYRADLVRARDPFYNEENIHADTEVCFELLKHVDFGFVHQVLTFTRVRPDSLTASSDELATNFAGMLHILATYGRNYLTAVEVDEQIERQLSEYYQYLGKSVFLGRDKRFWEYHKQKLSASRFSFSWPRVVAGALANLGSAVIAPTETFRRLVTRRR